MKYIVRSTGRGCVLSMIVFLAVFVITTELHAQHGSGTKAETETVRHANTGEQTVCPVMGGPINKALYVDSNGKRVYVCCDGCIDKVRADPAKYIKKLEAQGVTLATIPVGQTVCPVMGGPINKALYVDYDGKRVYVCCEGCIDKVKTDPSKYSNKLEAEGVTLAKTPVKQTLCPVKNTKINRAVYVDANGKRIYLCCQGCVDKVKADPSKYIGKLEAEGVILEKTPVQ